MDEKKVEQRLRLREIMRHLSIADQLEIFANFGQFSAISYYYVSEAMQPFIDSGEMEVGLASRILDNLVDLQDFTTTSEITSGLYEGVDIYSRDERNIPKKLTRLNKDITKAFDGMTVERQLETIAFLLNNIANKTKEEQK